LLQLDSQPLRCSLITSSLLFQALIFSDSRSSTLYPSL
jgi:hypothetical protein